MLTGEPRATLALSARNEHWLRRSKRRGCKCDFWVRGLPLWMQQRVTEHYVNLAKARARGGHVTFPTRQPEPRSVISPCSKIGVPLS